MNIQKELEICEHQPIVGYIGTDIWEIFNIWINRYGTENIHFICSRAYGLGKIHGKREERARRKKNVATEGTLS